MVQQEPGLRSLATPFYMDHWSTVKDRSPFTSVDGVLVINESAKKTDKKISYQKAVKCFQTCLF